MLCHIKGNDIINPIVSSSGFFLLAYFVVQKTITFFACQFWQIND
ncbi:hypothetical protein NT05HA_1830 [Aggregatibacter aphrophilus NJ8700]|nr:hypothetical protein NT05HA_1830 [Aggregatibacter aphrophilus NJ8700]